MTSTALNDVNASLELQVEDLHYSTIQGKSFFSNKVLKNAEVLNLDAIPSTFKIYYFTSSTFFSQLN